MQSLGAPPAQPAVETTPLPGPSRAAVIASVLAFAALGACAAWFLRSRAGPGDGGAPPTPSHRTAWEDPRPGLSIEHGGCGPIDPEVPAAVEWVWPEGTIEQTIDFGTVEQGAVGSREIEFRSVGPGPLCVHDAKSTCGCFAAELVDPMKRRYEPGEVGAVRVLMNMAGQEGRVEKKVNLWSNRTHGGVLTVGVRAHVGKGLVVQRGGVRFAPAPRNASSEATVRLSAPKEEGPFEITAVVGDGTNPDGSKRVFEWAVFPEQEHDPLRNHVRVVIVHPPRADVGQVSGGLTIHTTHPSRREIYLSYTFQVVERIRVSVPSITLGWVGAGRPVRPMRVRVTSAIKGFSFRVLDATIAPRAERTVPADGLGFRVESGKDNMGWWVDVRYDGVRREAGLLLEADLVITTDDAELPRLVVPVRAETK